MSLCCGARRTVLGGAGRPHALHMHTACGTCIRASHPKAAPGQGYLSHSRRAHAPQPQGRHSHQGTVNVNVDRAACPSPAHAEPKPRGSPAHPLRPGALARLLCILMTRLCAGVRVPCGVFTCHADCVSVTLSARCRCAAARAGWGSRRTNWRCCARRS